MPAALGMFGGIFVTMIIPLFGVVNDTRETCRLMLLMSLLARRIPPLLKGATFYISVRQPCMRVAGAK